MKQIGISAAVFIQRFSSLDGQRVADPDFKVWMRFADVRQSAAANLFRRITNHFHDLKFVCNALRTFCAAEIPIIIFER